MKQLIPNQAVRWTLYAVLMVVQYYLFWLVYRGVAHAQGIANPLAGYLVLVAMLLGHLPPSSLLARVGPGRWGWCYL